MVLYLKYLVWYRAVPYDTGHGTVPPVPVSSDSWYVPGTRYSWQVGFAAAISHARMRLSRLGRIGHAGRIAGRVGGTVSGPLSVPDDVGAAGWDAWWGRRSRWRYGPRSFWLSWPGRGAWGSRCGLLVLFRRLDGPLAGCF